MEREVSILVRVRDQAQQALERTSGRFEDMQGRMQNVSDRSVATGKTLSKRLTGPIVAAGGAAFAAGQRFAAQADEIDKASTRVGIAAEAYQELNFWAEQNGIGQATMERAVGRLNQRLADGERGTNQYVDAILDLGVATQDTNGNVRDTEDVLTDTIGKLMEVESSSERAAAAGEIFGTSTSRKLMPALEDGSLSIEEAAKQANELGGVMSEDTVDAGARLSDKMNELKTQFQGVFLEIAERLLPIVEDHLIPFIEEHGVPMVERFGEMIGRLVEWFTNLSPTVQKFIGIALVLLAAIGPVLVIFGKVISAVLTIGKVLMPIIKIVGLLVKGFLALNPVTLIVIAVITAVAGIAFLVIKYWDELVKFFTETIPEVFMNLVNRAEEMRQNFIDRIVGLVTGAVDWLRSLPGRAIRAVSGLIKRIWNWIKDVANRATDGAKGLVDDVVGFFKDLPSRAMDALGNIAGMIKDRLKDAAGSAWEGFKEGLGISSPSHIERALMAIEEQSEKTTSEMDDDVRNLQRASRQMQRIEGKERQLDTQRRAEPTSARASTDLSQQPAAQQQRDQDRSSPQQPQPAQQPQVNIELNIGTAVGSDEAGMRRMAVHLAKLVDQQMRAQGTNNIRLVRE